MQPLYMVILHGHQITCPTTIYGIWLTEYVRCTLWARNDIQWSIGGILHTYEKSMPTHYFSLCCPARQSNKITSQVLHTIHTFHTGVNTKYCFLNKLLWLKIITLRLTLVIGTITTQRTLCQPTIFVVTNILLSVHAARCVVTQRSYRMTLICLCIIFKHHFHVSYHASIPHAVRGVYFFSYS